IATSRTTPTKLATAPTFGSRESARISAPASKSCVCTETFIRRSPGERTPPRRPPGSRPWAAPCPGSLPCGSACRRPAPAPRHRRAHANGSAAPPPCRRPPATRFPRPPCRVARAAPQSREPSPSPVELRERQVAHPLALRDRVVRRVVDEAVGPGGRGEHGRILRGIQVQAALRIPSYAQVFTPRVGLGPLEIRACIDRVRRHLRDALRLQQERAHEDEEGD